MSTKTSHNEEGIPPDGKLIFQAVIDILPLSMATIPWGILCGSLAINVGLSPIQAQLMSLLVFAGAAQLVAINIIGVIGSTASIFSSTFVISSRHLLYSAVFREQVRDASLGLRCCIAFFLTDEMFAVTCSFMERYKVFSAVYALSSGITFYVIWNLATFTGIVAAQYIPNLEHLGFEFAIAATFIAIVIPTIKNKSTLLAVITSGLSVVILSVYARDYALIVSTIIGMTFGYLSSIKENKLG
ncbi:AzlC family ABC transporter permease [Paraglaciecola sp.]|uniref:AzlC family ABC transporter permease n=1 Tax=Paraglaciecola sp. TaxID=1920173 RepID=UPI003EF859D2